MENASKALIMAASVLLGVMILSVGVYLFYVYSDYSSNAYQQLEQAQINQFNTQFLKYYGMTAVENEKEEPQPILCTAHDIISLANLAYQNNLQYEVDNLNGYNVNTYYIQIDVGNTKATKNLEKWDEQTKLSFIQQNSVQKVETTDTQGNTVTITEPKYYYCESEPIVSNITKRVCYMKFKEYVP